MAQEKELVEKAQGKALELVEMDLG